MSLAGQPLPRWADLFLLPVVNLAVALLAAGAMVALVGQNPLEVIRVLIHGAFGTERGLSYTLYYTTTFIFTGLAVSVAFHGGLFNIGGEGQAILGGLGTGLVALWLSGTLPAWVMLPLMVLAGALFQGGAEVSFEVKGFSRDMVVMLQGFIVLFSGAMAYVLAPWVTSAIGALRGAPKESTRG